LKASRTRRVLDPGKRVGDVSEKVLAPAQVAALVPQRDAHLCERVLSLARAVRRLGNPAHEALQRHIECLLLHTRERCSVAQLLQRLDAHPDLACGLADRICRRDRAIDQRAETADRRGAQKRTSEGSDASAQQLRLAAEALQPTRGALTRALDALQALLAALADRDQLGLDLAAALDRQGDRVGVGASGHGSGISRRLRARHGSAHQWVASTLATVRRDGHPDSTRLARQVICSQVPSWECSIRRVPGGGPHREIWRKRSKLDREGDGSTPR
jgi:hypothetical protein